MPMESAFNFLLISVGMYYSILSIMAGIRLYLLISKLSSERVRVE